MTIEQESTPPLPVMAATFDEFHAATSRRTLALAYALTGNWGDDEDLVQDAYIAAARKWDELARYDDPSSWVRRIVLNRSVSRWRRLQRETLAVVRLGHRTDDSVRDDDPMDPQFWAAVRRLPAQQARAVALYYVDDLSVEQVALAPRVLGGLGEDPPVPCPRRAGERPADGGAVMNEFALIDERGRRPWRWWP